ncbi:probable G-protein coupled receptor B0563.6 [Galendromus occidentalis]|uniref:Probable G-protein coupled receptor B0563.6 n=1 Tax=Galendromus occidentalis TaxID=34638 RepID=A0AAJ6QTW9_9ACAR|nr:probable G-protein coupled receptor B0563.6 [Galendromus occidentalis]
MCRPHEYQTGVMSSQSRWTFDSASLCPSVEDPTSFELEARSGQQSFHELQERLATVKFLAYGVVAIFIIVLGFIGNVINLIVLTRPNLKGVTYVYLTWLATFDLLSLIFALFSVLRLHGIQPKSYTAAFFYAHLEMPLVNSAMTSSIYIVLAVTLDRYWSVCLPCRYKDIHTERCAHRAIFMSFLLPLILYIPVAFQKEPTRIINPYNGQEEWVPCDRPAVAQHPIYRLYLIMKEVIVRFGPVIAIAVLNTTIILTFRKLQKKRKSLMGSSESRRFAEERRLVILLASIVIMFCVCMTPAAINTLLNGDRLDNNYTYQVFRAFANDMEITNFATNFYVYCLCSTEIRKTFIRVFIDPLSLPFCWLAAPLPAEQPLVRISHPWR